MLLYSSLPATPLFGLRREVDRLFDDVFGRQANGVSSGANGTGHTPAWMPAADVRETSDGFALEFEIPGVAPENVHVTTENGMLTIRGEKTAEQTSESDRWHVTERMRGTFARSFALPEAIDEGGIDASFANGVLTVRVPKAAKPEPKRIVVKTK